MKKGNKLNGRKIQKFGICMRYGDINACDFHPYCMSKIEELKSKGWHVFEDSINVFKDKMTDKFIFYCRCIFLGKKKCLGCNLTLKEMGGKFVLPKL